MCQYLGDIGSFIRNFWESPSSHSQRRCQELCHENYVKIYGKYFVSIVLKMLYN
jgi:hypothetical protein